MTNLETAISFYSSEMTEEQIEKCRKRAVLISSQEEAIRQNVSYCDLLNQNLFTLVFEEYKRKYGGQQT